MTTREYRLIDEDGDTTGVIEGIGNAEVLQKWLNADTPFNYRIQFRDVPDWEDYHA